MRHYENIRKLEDEAEQAKKIEDSKFTVEHTGGTTNLDTHETKQTEVLKFD